MLIEVLTESFGLWALQRCDPVAQAVQRAV